MNKTGSILIWLSLMLPLSSAGARQAHIRDRAAAELEVSRALWFASDNAAGLSTPLPAHFNTVDLGYSMEYGDWHRVQTGRSLGTMTFDTRGFTSVGKINLWGHFRYDRSAERGARYNTILTDPLDERFLFGVADPVSSDWRKQSYDMEFKAATQVSDVMSAGLHVRYTDRIASKQVDPRVETYRRDIELRPGVTISKGRQRFGANLLYANIFERAVPTLSNSWNIQDVFVSRGLGNYTIDVVGSNGLSTIFYRCSSMGGALQYGHKGDSELLAELGVTYHITRTTESATQPYKMGSTGMIEVYTSLQWLTTAGKLSARASWTNTRATEYTSVFDLSVNKWDVRSSAVMSRYNTLHAEALYDWYPGSDALSTYSWKLSAGAAWTDKRDKYFIPESTMSYDNVMLSAGAHRHFALDRGTLDTGATLSGNINLSGQYLYGGSRSYSGMYKDSTPADVWFPTDMEVLSSHYVMPGLDICRTVELREGLSLGLSASAAYLASFKASRHRTYASVSIGLIF